MGDTIAVLLSATNQFLQTSTWGSTKFTPNKRKTFSELPLGDVNGDGTGEIGLKVYLIGSNGSSFPILGTQSDGSALTSLSFVAGGGKAVTFSSYAPAYGSGTAAELALDRVTGGLLTQPVKGPSVATATNVTANAASVTLLTANAARKGVIIYNNSDKVMHLSLQATATTDNSSYEVAPEVGGLNGGSWELPFQYTGTISAIWETAPTGKANVTEITQ